MTEEAEHFWQNCLPCTCAQSRYISHYYVHVLLYDCWYWLSFYFTLRKLDLLSKEYYFGIFMSHPAHVSASVHFVWDQAPSSWNCFGYNLSCNTYNTKNGLHFNYWQAKCHALFSRKKKKKKYRQDKLHYQLRWAWKMFYNHCARPRYIWHILVLNTYEY